VGSIVFQSIHLGVQGRLSLGRVAREGITLGQQAVCGEADCLALSRGYIGRRMFSMVDIASRDWIIRRPGVAHSRRNVEQDRGMHGWIGQIDPNCRQCLFIPNASHAVAWGTFRVPDRTANCSREQGQTPELHASWSISLPKFESTSTPDPKVFWGKIVKAF